MLVPIIWTLPLNTFWALSTVNCSHRLQPSNVHVSGSRLSLCHKQKWTNCSEDTERESRMSGSLRSTLKRSTTQMDLGLQGWVWLTTNVSRNIPPPVKTGYNAKTYSALFMTHVKELFVLLESTSSPWMYGKFITMLHRIQLISAMKLFVFLVKPDLNCSVHCWSLHGFYHGSKGSCMMPQCCGCLWWLWFTVGNVCITQKCWLPVFIFLCSMINPNLNKKLNPFTIIIVCASHPCFFYFLYFFTLLCLCVELLWRFLFRTIYMMSWRAMSLMCSPQMYRSGCDHRSPINLLFKPSVSEECWLKGRLKRAMLAHFRQMNWGASLSSTYSREVQE